MTTIGSGSSPLTRGKPGMSVRSQTVRGLIPAHAGKTLCWSLVLPFSRAHPRSRGENQFSEACVIVAMGSSPLTRGKPSIPRTGRIAEGLIPAHAGKTKSNAGIPANQRAHPRSRGENSQALAPAPTPGGSSPLTRGKLRAEDERPRREGLIPAHAGKTVSSP